MIKRTTIIGLMMLLCGALTAQNMTSSPFSRYAYGDMNENVPTGYRGMGGVGFGLRNNRAINPAQPASYTSCDTLTFMFDVAASACWSRYQDASGMRNKANGNLEYLTIQVPLWKRWIAMSVGLLPYSSVGYSITLSDSTAGGGYHYNMDYAGEGNISQVYGGLSFNVCNWFAFGANVYYMWGELSHMRMLSFSETKVNSTIQYENLSVSNVRFRAGAQLFHRWGDHAVSLGAVFEPKLKLNSELLVFESQGDTAYLYTDGWQLPMVWGVGGSYNWANRLTVAFDYERQNMASAMYGGVPGSLSGLQDRNRYAFGVEYRHNPMGRNYAERMLWRTGLSVQDEYVTIVGGKKITASIGIGFPLYTIGTVINMTVEYTHRGAAGSLEDNGLRFTLGASIAENWFFKRKL